MPPTIVFNDEMMLPMSRARAWELMTDPQVVVSCVPGAEIVSIDDDGTIHGRLTLSMGPSETRFEGRIVPTFDEDACTGELVGQGADGKGRTRAAVTTKFSLADGQETGTTRFAIGSEISVSGALAGFAKAGGQAVAKRLLTDFSENLSRLESADVDDEPRLMEPQRLGIVSLLFRTAWDAIRRLMSRTKTKDARKP